jgi:peptide/nickel transport system ATP-binding protein
MGTLVNAENIRGVYYTEGKDVVAVNDVSIKIEEGEVLGLAGESGSGKTTLGSIISLIARPPLHVEEGTLEIDGQVQELGGHAKIPRTWRGAVVSMLPQGAMNSISPTKRIRQLVYDVMRSHEAKISKGRGARPRSGTAYAHWACRPASSTRTPTSSPEA